MESGGATDAGVGTGHDGHGGFRHAAEATTAATGSAALVARDDDRLRRRRRRADGTGRHGGAAAATTAYVPVGPVRLADTRDHSVRVHAASAGTIWIDVAGHAGGPGRRRRGRRDRHRDRRPRRPAIVTAFPGGTDRPLAATLNTRTDRNVVELGDRAGRRRRHDRAVPSSSPGELIVDVTGVFVARRVEPRSGASCRSPPGDSSTPDGPVRDRAARRRRRAHACRLPQRSRRPMRPPSSSTSRALAARQPGYLSARPAGAAGGGPRRS